MDALTSWCWVPPIEIRDGLIPYLAYLTEGDQVVVHRGRPVIQRNAIPLTVPWRD